MRVVMRRVRNKDEEQVVLECVEMTKEFENIKWFVQNQTRTLSGYQDDKVYNIPVETVLYFETVDEKVFAYTGKQVYEIKRRMYEIEAEYREWHFIRCSRQVILNLMKLKCISPEINGRFIAHMKNEEQLIITRQYVPDLKKAVIGERRK